MRYEQQAKNVIDFIAKPLSNGSVALLIINRDIMNPQKYNQDLYKLAEKVEIIDSAKWTAASQYFVFDIWTDAVSETFQYFDGELKPYEVKFVIITPVNGAV